MKFIKNLVLLGSATLMGWLLYESWFNFEGSDVWVGTGTGLVFLALIARAFYKVNK